MLHLVDPRLACPSPELLPVKVEWNSKQTPQSTQAHVQHNRLYKATLCNPWGDELAEPIAPQILINRNSDKDRAGNGLVAINSIRADDCWQGSNLYAGGSVSNYDNYLD